jgi:putative transcriptional regulator
MARCETGRVTATAGRLLVAEPMLGDPNFDRTVVLVIEHTAEGALGLVLNRPTDLLVAEALPAWRHLVADPPVLHVGGPVEERSGWCLARAVDPTGLEGFVPVLGDLGLLDLSLDPDLLVGAVTDLRLFAGYSGWGPRQLDHELAAEAWIVVDADVDDPFLPDGAALWSRILARQGGSLARLATFPPDPSLN